MFLNKFSPGAKVTFLLLSSIVCGICSYLSYVAFQPGEPLLVLDDRELVPAKEGFAEMHHASLRFGQTYEHLAEIEIRGSDLRKGYYGSNLNNIALQKGWFPHSYHHRSNTNGILTPSYLVVPRDELGEVEALAANPVGWIVAERGPGPAMGPSSTDDLVNVKLSVTTTHRQIFWMVVVWAAVTVGGSALAFWFLGALYNWLLPNAGTDATEANRA